MEYTPADPFEDIQIPDMQATPSVPSLPFNQAAEEAVIGSVLINPEGVHDLAFLKADHFYIHRMRWIWEAFTRMSERRIPIDFVTVCEELEKGGQLCEIGGTAYLTALLNQSPNSFNLESYARIVEGHALRRRMITAANIIAAKAYDVEASTIELQETAAQAVYNAVETVTGDGEKLSASVSRVYEKTSRNADLRIAGYPLDLGLMTGYVDIDRILQGIEGGELVTVAGRPGMGKSALMLNIARNCALKNKKHVAVFSLETINDEVTRRLLAMESEIDSQRIKSGALREEEWPLFTNAIGTLDTATIYIDDTSNLTPVQLRSKCLRYANRQGLDVVFVDYIQLMSTGVRKENRTQEVSYISRQLKMLAQELKIPVFAASQLSRAVEQRADKHPQLSDLRESGSIEQDSNIVMFLYREDKYERDTAKQNIVEINIAKRRDGPTGTAELIFRQALTRFENAATKHIDFNQHERRDLE
jgi:replicative DNA helicase